MRLRLIVLGLCGLILAIGGRLFAVWLFDRLRLDLHFPGFYPQLQLLPLSLDLLMHLADTAELISAFNDDEEFQISALVRKFLLNDDLP